MSVKTKIDNNELSAGHAAHLLPKPRETSRGSAQGGPVGTSNRKPCENGPSISDPKDQDRRSSIETRKKSLDPDTLSAQNQLEEALGLKVILNVKGETVK